MFVYFVCFVLVNCLLNAFAICVGEVTVFSFKVSVFFYCVGILLANPCIVFKEYACCVCDPVCV